MMSLIESLMISTIQKLNEITEQRKQSPESLSRMTIKLISNYKCFVSLRPWLKVIWMWLDLDARVQYSISVNFWSYQNSWGQLDIHKTKVCFSYFSKYFGSPPALKLSRLTRYISKNLIKLTKFEYVWEKPYRHIENFNKVFNVSKFLLAHIIHNVSHVIYLNSPREFY